MWANCPMAWKLKYVDGHVFENNSIHLIFGTAMHEVIQDWLSMVFNKSETAANSIDLSDQLEQKLSTMFKASIQIDENGSKVFLCDRQTLTDFYTQGCQIIEYIQKHRKNIFPTKDVELIGIEHELNIEVKPNVHYIGYIDIVTKNTITGAITIYDLKTSKSGWSSYQKSDPIKLQQLLLYKKFFSEQMNVPENLISVEFVILKRTIFESDMYHIPRVSKFEPANGKPSVNKAWNAMQAFINECFDENGDHKVDTIKANSSKNNCRWCVYKDKKNLCPYGV
jgi:hypothetical protein